MTIKFCYETGILEARAPIKKVKEYIEETMGRLERIHNGSRSTSSESPPEDAIRKNTNIARMAGIKSLEEWESAVKTKRVLPWHYYNDKNDKITPKPEL